MWMKISVYATAILIYRRPEMQDTLKLRHKVTIAMRKFLDGEGFYEIETPMLCKSSPEGARDYLVPSRVHPGSFTHCPKAPNYSSKS